MPLFSVVQLFDGCRSRVRVTVQYACNRAGCVDRDGEGSTGPSRGEHRLTVYRAHASVFVVSSLFPGRISLVRTGFFMTPKSRDFHEILTFLRNCQDASWKLLRCIRSVIECIRVRRNALDHLKRNL